MSSFDRGTAGRRPLARAGLLALAAVALLSACTVQPLYGPTVSGQTTEVVLSQIVVEPVETRVAQQVRNRLIFTLNGGTQPVAPVYRLRLTVSTNEIELGINTIQSAPSYSVFVTATYEVTSIATGDIILRATSRDSASYDRVNQVFANVRARQDAENRAAVAVAEDIRIRLATAAVNGF